MHLRWSRLWNSGGARGRGHAPFPTRPLSIAAQIGINFISRRITARVLRCRFSFTSQWFFSFLKLWSVAISVVTWHDMGRVEKGRSVACTTWLDEPMRKIVPTAATTAAAAAYHVTHYDVTWMNEFVIIEIVNEIKSIARPLLLQICQSNSTYFQ